MASVSGLSSANGAAIAGIRNAFSRLDTAAADVLHATLDANDPVSISSDARGATGSGNETGQIAHAMVDMRVARYQAAASVAVLRTSDDMTTDLLRLGTSHRG